MKKKRGVGGFQKSSNVLKRRVDEIVLKFMDKLFKMHIFIYVNF